ncbi:hypothetical protein OAK45_07160 [Verrucomicrobia bacterium]|nr:hypothetical protein [Verrucomicrobiota bacterium]MDC0218361.1 hypothetical protein [Verrucomicrobiota bacterium]
MRIFLRILFEWVALMFSLATAKEQQHNMGRMGRVLKKQLDGLKLADNTIVVFTNPRLTSPKSSNACGR